MQHGRGDRTDAATTKGTAMNHTTRKRLLLGVASVATAATLGLGTTSAFGQVGASDPTPTGDSSTAVRNVVAAVDDALRSEPAPGTDNPSEPEAHDLAVEADAVDADAVAATVAMFYEPGEVEQHDCISVIERRIVPSLLPPGVDVNDVWLQPNGTRTEALSTSGEPTGITELGNDGDRIVLREYDEGNVVTYDIPQDVIVSEFAPCADRDSALEVVVNSDMANLASIYHEASRNADGSIQILFRVQKDGRYSPETFAGEFAGRLDSPDYGAFLDSMPDSVRAQVEDFAAAVRTHLGAGN